MAKIKSCPFCGGTAHIDKNTSLTMIRDFIIYCEGCDSYFLLDDVFASEEDVIKAYNRRAKNDK